MSPLRLASRGSALARAQAELAATALRDGGATAIELVIVRTQGDRSADTPVQLLGGEGWFTAALEEALVEGRADLAVHSAKDLPSRLAPDLPVLAFLERADCRDGVVTPRGGGLDTLPEGATVGTSSARRAALLRGLRPDLRPVPLRGNVDTRLAKLDGGEVDALLLACAGLDRIGRGGRIAERFDPRVFVPAPCQGAIALQGSPTGAGAIPGRALDHPTTRTAAAAERAVLAALGGGCLLALGAWARLEGDRLVVTAALDCDGEIHRAELAGDPGAPEELGRRVAGALR